ncbi:MAG: hypothetical protein AMDU1_APLC00082G0038 [Thermoplasmatales archaeon A-plasma]|nr:MAG: hypothetical protein AMDU1_APLC00082G0038 [Thermoplasmatales archaeon A-plasma]
MSFPEGIPKSKRATGESGASRESPGSPRDSGAIVALKEMTHLPVCADPSHPAGRRDLVELLALAAVAAGATMLEIEVHNDPDRALSDAEQQITPDRFRSLSRNARDLFQLLHSTSAAPF